MFASSQEASRSRSIDRLFKRGVTKELVFGEAELSFNVQKVFTGLFGSFYTVWLCSEPFPRAYVHNERGFFSRTR